MRGRTNLKRRAHICRYLHGKMFSMADALQRFDRIEQLDDPEDIKRAMPWVRESIDPETGRTRLSVDGGAGHTDLAEVTRSAMGTRDDPPVSANVAGKVRAPTASNVVPSSPSMQTTAEVHVASIATARSASYPTSSFTSSGDH